MNSLVMIIVGCALINNVVLNQFLGICSFLGVSKQMKASASLGGAVIFVLTIASAVASLLYDFILKPFDLDYMKTIVFILVIAALVQIVEMFLKKTSPGLYKALGIYLPLITTNCAVLGVALTNVQDEYNFIESVFAGFGSTSFGRAYVHRLYGLWRTVIRGGNTGECYYHCDDRTCCRRHCRRRRSRLYRQQIPR